VRVKRAEAVSIVVQLKRAVRRLTAPISHSHSVANGWLYIFWKDVKTQFR
jgi:hypothetical protein